MNDEIDYEMIEILRWYIDLQSYQLIIDSLNNLKDKYNLDAKEFNHTLYLVLKIVSVFSVYYYTDIETYDDYIDKVCEALDKYGNYIKDGTYSLFYTIVNILYGMQFTKVKEKTVELFIKKVAGSNVSHNVNMINNYIDFIGNLSFKKRIDKASLTEYLKYQYNSDHMLVLDFFSSFFSELSVVRYSHIARYLKEKMDAINVINNEVFSKNHYDDLNLIRSLDIYEIEPEDLEVLNAWISENIFSYNVEGFKTVFTILCEQIKNYLKEYNPPKIDSKVIYLDDVREKSSK